VLDLSVLNELRRRTDIFSKRRGQTWYYLFSRSGFTKAVLNEAADNENIVLVDLQELMAE
jgi:adenosyl cobinamide kinase/adenosyl cobinamide phosphate guanylyltransferase